MKSIGIAICAFYGHILPLKKALESIEGQTKKPDMVIVSCSSCEQKDIPYTPQMYSFPLMIITHRDKKNAAQNRNFAAELLQTDIICFFDADDIMHPQRIEIIHNCFMTYDIKLFLHNTQLNIPDTIVPYTDCTYILNKLGMCRFGSTILQMYLSKDIVDHNKYYVYIFLLFLLFLQPVFLLYNTLRNRKGILYKRGYKILYRYYCKISESNCIL